MGLQTFVKISNVSSLSDARYCAGMGVDVLGFNIDPNLKECISPNDFKEITDWVAGVDFAGEFNHATLDEIRNAIHQYALNFIQLSSIDLVEKVGLLGIPLIFQLTLNSEEELNQLESNLSHLDELVSMVVIKSENEELYDQLDQRLAFYNGNLKLIKGFGIVSTEEMSKFPGLEMEATKEEKPGFKDYGEIMDVLEAIEEL